jgi:hypothetical protein
MPIAFDVVVDVETQPAPTKLKTEIKNPNIPIILLNFLFISILKKIKVYLVVYKISLFLTIKTK